MKPLLMKWGNSQGIRLPKHLLESAEIGEHDALEVVAENRSIVIKKANKKPRKSIQERFQGFTGEYEFEVIDWGKPVGREIW